MRRNILKFDVIIVGASSSGLYAAEMLAREGKHVGVFERQQDVNPAKRTYIITPQINAFIEEIPGQVELCQTSVMSLESSNAAVNIPLPNPDLIIERKLLTQMLFDRAVDLGVEIFTGHRFLKFDQVGRHTKLIFGAEGNEIVAHTNAVIGADGINSQTAIAAGISLPPSISIVQSEIDLPPEWDPAITKVWFDTDDTPFFYWLIPESNQRGVLGLAGGDSKQIRRILDRLLAKLNFHAIGYQSSRVAMHHPKLRPWGKVGTIPVYLIGDAAGQVKVTTVGGTVTGLWGARAAVRAILKGNSYARELRPLKRELDLHWVIRLLLDTLDNHGYDRLIENITPPVQRFLGLRNRDQMVGGIWQLPFLESGLFVLALRTIKTILSSLLRHKIIARGDPEIRG